MSFIQKLLFIVATGVLAVEVHSSSVELIACFGNRLEWVRFPERP
jgi:hypothetical protein